MATNITFRLYALADLESCLGLFDANCPEFFAPNERDHYADFLQASPDGYELCVVNDRVVGAFGLIGGDTRRRSLNWIMLDPQSQGLGVGSAIMDRVAKLGTAAGLELVNIAASHKSAPFFARFGAVTATMTQDGWGPGMHRVDMELILNGPNINAHNRGV